MCKILYSLGYSLAGEGNPSINPPHRIRRANLQKGHIAICVPVSSLDLNGKALFMNGLQRTNWLRTFVQLARVDPEVVAPDFDCVGFHADGLVHRQLAGRYVVLPAVPRTGDGDTVE